MKNKDLIEALQNLDPEMSIYIGHQVPIKWLKQLAERDEAQDAGVEFQGPPEEPFVHTYKSGRQDIVIKLGAVK